MSLGALVEAEHQPKRAEPLGETAKCQRARRSTAVQKGAGHHHDAAIAGTHCL
jgi:hypothetical protein